MISAKCQLSCQVASPLPRRLPAWVPRNSRTTAYRIILKREPLISNISPVTNKSRTSFSVLLPTIKHSELIHALGRNYDPSRPSLNQTVAFYRAAIMSTQSSSNLTDYLRFSSNSFHSFSNSCQTYPTRSVERLFLSFFLIRGFWRVQGQQAYFIKLPILEFSPLSSLFIATNRCFFPFISLSLLPFYDSRKSFICKARNVGNPSHK
jgi:hypothetical protein